MGVSGILASRISCCHHLGRGRPRRTSACGQGGAPIKPGQPSLESPMGVYVIVAFIAVIAILNRVEFGRFD
jgi:hypothetical protein